MKLQKLYALTTFIVLMRMLSANGMEPNYDAVIAMQQAEQYNCTHLLLCLPQEIQHQIIFPQYTQSTEITWDKMNELKEVVKTFFIFTSVSKYFNQYFKLPWSDLELAKKNKMLKKSIDHIIMLEYKKYCMVPLALVYSGADADVKPKLWHTCLVRSVDECEESVVVMLLNRHANPNQVDTRGVPICFRATTFSIINLFLEKIDKDEVLSKSENVAWHLINSCYSSEIMTFWLDYGVSLRTIDVYGNCILHELVHSICRNWNGSDNLLIKGDLLLKRIPDMINWVNPQGKTPIDLAMSQIKNCYTSTPSFRKADCRCESSRVPESIDSLGAQKDRFRSMYEDLIVLFRKYGGKTAKELKTESVEK